MTIKSLFLGSAAALVAVSGAQAADAVVIPEPELVEYVRVCDTYGTGFFYIPGTETCLAISGYVRYEMNFASNGNSGDNLLGANDETRASPLTGPHVDGDGDFGKRSEVRVNIDARNETELGTLRSYIRLGYDTRPSQDGDGDTAGFGIDHAYITLAGLTIGKKNTFWDWGFGADGDGLVSFGPGDLGMVAYTVNAGGFAYTLALEEDENGNYTPDVVLDMNGSIGDIALHGGVAYNESAEAFSAKIYAAYDFGVATVGLGYQFSEDDALGADYLAGYEHVIGGDISAALTEKMSARAGFNYGLDNAAGLDAYVVGAGVNYKLVSGFDIDARVNYSGGDAIEAANGGDGVTSGRIRFTRSF